MYEKSIGSRAVILIYALASVPNVPSELSAGRGGLQYVCSKPSARMVSQEMQMSCGAACARQLLLDTGIDLSEATIRGVAKFDSRFGISPSSLANALSRPDATYVGGGVPPEAFSALAAIGTWVARLKPVTGPHYVLVDRVEERLVHIRDPWGPEGPGSAQGIEATLTVEEFLQHWRVGINQVIFRKE